MATQTGSIDLRGANSAKLYVDDEAGEIRSEVSETYATKTEVQRTDTGSGTVVTSDDAANLPPLSLTIHGKSVQDGTPSPSSPVEIRSVEPYNLLDLGEITFTRFKKVGLGETFPTGQYVFSADIDTDYTGNSFRVLFYNGNAEAGGWYLTVTNGRISGQVHPTSSFDAIGLYAGYNYSEAGGHTATYTNIQLEVGGTEHRYQPKGEIDLRINGKNLFDKDNPNAIAAYVNSAGAMVSSTPDLSAVIPVIGGETYTVSGTKVQLSGTSADDWACAAFQVRPTAGSQGTVMFYNKYNSNATMPQTFTVPSNCSYIALKYANTSRVDATATAATIQLEYGTQATDYEPYVSTVVPIDLQGEILGSVPSGAENTIDIDSEGNITLTKRASAKAIKGSMVLRSDGTSADNIQQYVINVGEAIKWVNDLNIRAISNMYAGYIWGNSWRQNNVIVNYTGTSLRIMTNEQTTVEEFKAFLDSHNVMAIYELATPQTISLGKIDLPSLPSPSFSMHVDATVDTTLDAEWWTTGGEEVGSVYQRTSALEQDVDGITLELSEKVDSSEEWVSWLHAGTDATTHEPYLAMGKNSAYPSVVYGSDAARFYDGEGDAASNVVASFGTDGVVVGKDGSANTTISDSEIVFHDADGNEAGKISMSSEGAVPASATYTITTSSTGTVSDTITGITPLPDFTLGYLVLRTKVSSGGGGIMRIESWSDVASPVTMSTSTIDYTFKATPNGDTWGIEITATNRSGTTASQTVEYTLEWYYSGSAPQYKFGTGENAGAYSFLAGLGLETAKPAQVVLGSYNEPSQTDLLIVGNGTSDGNRSNALRVDENSVLHIISFSQYGGGVELTQSALWSWQQALFGFADSDWTYLAGSVSGNFCRWRFKSGWVQVEIYYASGAGLSANTAKNYGTIPGNFRPDHEVNNALYLGANKNGQADMWVTNGGAVWVNSTIASSTVYGQLQYPL